MGLSEPRKGELHVVRLVPTERVNITNEKDQASQLYIYIYINLNV